MHIYNVTSAQLVMQKLCSLHKMVFACDIWRRKASSEWMEILYATYIIHMQDLPCKYL